MQSSKILRILKISKKYNERPSKVIGIPEQDYLAFCFDEACEYILSMKSTREIRKEDKVYLEEYWIEEPKWSDKEEVKFKKVNNNASLIDEMKANLEKYK